MDEQRPDRTDEEREALREQIEADEAAEREASALLAAYPAAEHGAVVRGVYFDGDGRLRTRHRQLRTT